MLFAAHVAVVHVVLLPPVDPWPAGHATHAAPSHRMFTAHATHVRPDVPGSLNPALHAHVYDPTLFVHVASALQASAPVAHSSTSVHVTPPFVVA